MADLLKRTELTYENLKEIDENRPEIDDSIGNEVQIPVSYTHLDVYKRQLK